MDSLYHEFRQTEIKSQLSDGFMLILGYEQSVRERLQSSPPGSPDHPFPTGQHLVEVTALWSTLCRKKEFGDFIQQEIDRLVQRKFAQMKGTISHLLSLLAAMDAVPLAYVPIIQFDRCNMTDTDVLTTDERCIALDYLHESAVKQVAECRDKIVAISMHYLPTNTESQIALFHTLIGSQRVHYDEAERLLLPTADLTAISDYIYHPGSLAAPAIKKITEEHNHATFCELTREFADIFQLESREEVCITSVVLSSILNPLFWIDVKSDGSGSEDMVTQ
jgi:hypothetical protein